MEHTDLVVDPMDLHPATPGATDHQIAPDIGDNTVERWVILGRIIGRIASRILFDQFQRLNHRAMNRIIGAERQHLKQRRQHPSIVGAVGAAHHGLGALPADETGRAQVDNQLLKGGLVHHWKEDLLDNPIGMIEGGFRHPAQDAHLVGNAGNFIDQFFGGPLFGLEADMMNHVDQQVNQRIRHLAGA